MSSSYSLGDVLVVGMDKNGHTAQNLTINKEVVVNYLLDDQGLLAELAGFTSGKSQKDKSSEINCTFNTFNSTPYIEDAMITILGFISQIVEDGEYYLVFIKINHRKVNPTLLVSDKALNYSRINPLLFLGDGNKRVYKTTSEMVVCGTYYKNKWFNYMTIMILL